MAKSKLKLEAFVLRKKGKSIREIVSLLGMPLSTVSYWCRDIKLSLEQRKLLVKHQKDRAYAGRLKSAEILKSKRVKITKKLKEAGIEEIGKLTKKEIFLAGIGLYWGEGYRSQERVGFTSRDWKIIKFIIGWFERFFDAKRSDFILRISVNKEHRDRIKKIEKYWSQMTGIPLSQFTKPSFIKASRKKVYFSRENYYGTLRIVLRKSCLKHRKLMGWIEGLYRNTPT